MEATSIHMKLKIININSARIVLNVIRVGQKQIFAYVFAKQNTPEVYLLMASHT